MYKMAKVLTYGRAIALLKRRGRGDFRLTLNANGMVVNCFNITDYQELK